MRIGIPWGGIALVGGTVVLTMTDWPSIVGWVLVIWGVVSLILQIAVVLMGTAILNQATKLTPDDVRKMAEEGKVYKTNHGRTRVRPTSKQS